VGLACAIGAARRGLKVVVLEKGAWPRDKACGEGLMPSGVHALERLGVRPLLDPAGFSPFAGIRYVQEDGSWAEARFPAASGGGLGIRRLALVEAMLRRAHQLGVELRASTCVRRLSRSASAITVETENRPIAARLVVAADGLASPL